MTIAIVLAANACEINFSIEKNKKEIYSIGDEVVVKVQVIHTHRNCSLEIDKTKIDYKGIDILSATKWSETKPGTFERKFKIKIKDANNGNVYLSAIRECNKDGGKATIKFVVK